MSNTGKILLGAAVGAMVGWVVGEILADHFAPEYYTEEELEELLAENAEILDENEYHPNQVKPPKEISEIRKDIAMSKKKKRDYRAFYKGEVKEDLANLVSKYNDPDGIDAALDDVEIERMSDEIDVEYTLEDDDVDARDKTEIYIMTREEWDSNETGHTQVTLHYYPEDDVLTDSRDRPLRSVEKVVGPDALSNFGTFSDDEHIVYVCNPHNNAEYEILLQNGSYSDNVLGKPPRKRGGRTGKAVVHNVFEDLAKEDLKVEEGDEQD